MAKSKKRKSVPVIQTGSSQAKTTDTPEDRINAVVEKKSLGRAQKKRQDKAVKVHNGHGARHRNDQHRR